MARLNKTVGCDTILTQIINKQNSKTEFAIKEYHMENPFRPTKEQLWKLFQNEFKLSTGKELIVNEETIKNFKTLIHYFLMDDEFFKSENLHSMSSPSFDKGLFIVSGYGTGKTAYMKSLEQCCMKLRWNPFKLYSTNQIVIDYESCAQPLDKGEFFKKMKRGAICFDDLGTERVANNYGGVNLLKEILEERYSANKITHITCNYIEGDNNNVDATMMHLGETYGGRIHDRFFDMFNVVVFKGKSMRR